MDESLASIFAEKAEPPQAEKKEAPLPETTAMKVEEAPVVSKAIFDNASPVKIIVKVRSSLKVRSKPSLDGKVVGSLKNNDIRILGAAS